jgi:hypothetical protein
VKFPADDPAIMLKIEAASNKSKLTRQAMVFALLGWPAADLAVVIGLLISGTAHASTSDWLRMLVQVGLIGVFAGVAVWALCRLLGQH